MTGPRNALLTGDCNQNKRRSHEDRLRPGPAHGSVVSFLMGLD